MGVTPETRHILLLDPDVERLDRLTAALSQAGHRVSAFPGLRQATRRQVTLAYDAVIATQAWPPSTSAQRVRALKRHAKGIPLLLFCSADRVDEAVAALRHGADDYLMLPPDSYELKARLDRLLERTELDSRIAFFQDELSKRSGLRSLEARSPAMQSAVARVLRVAPMRSTVLIYGESGVGKELVARSIHFNSPRRNKPFIALNCAAMPGNLIESELFGHEKGSFTGAHARVHGQVRDRAPAARCSSTRSERWTPDTQAKLLRVLEEREFMRVGGNQSIRVDVRVIAATNADLEAMVARGTFPPRPVLPPEGRDDHGPPLRDRREDIPALVSTFLDELARENAVFASRSRRRHECPLQDYAWPGNVRELKNMLESVLVSVPGEVIRHWRTCRRPCSPSRIVPAPDGVQTRDNARGHGARVDRAHTRAHGRQPHSQRRRCSGSECARFSGRSRRTASESAEATSTASASQARPRTSVDRRRRKRERLRRRQAHSTSFLVLTPDSAPLYSSLK